MATVFHTLLGNKEPKSPSITPHTSSSSKHGHSHTLGSESEVPHPASCLKPLVMRPPQSSGTSSSTATPGSSTPGTQSTTSATTRLKQVFFRCDGDKPPVGTKSHLPDSSSFPIETGDSDGGQCSSAPPHPRNRAQSDSHQHEVSAVREQSRHHASIDNGNTSKKQRSKSPRFKIIEKLRNRSLSGSTPSQLKSSNSQDSSSSKRAKRYKNPDEPPANPALLPSVPPEAHQLLFTTVSLKNCKGPRGHRRSDGNILCEHHGEANLQFNKRLVASLRHQLPHSLSTSADELLSNLPPPTGVSSRLEQVLFTQEQSLERVALRRSTNNIIAKVAESEKFLMLCRKSHTHTEDELHLGHMGEDSGVAHFLSHSTCYDLMPDNSKLVAFDTRLPIGKAFRALLSNGLRAAPLWDAHRLTFVGLLTLRDFLLILLHYHQRPLHSNTDTWTEVSTEHPPPQEGDEEEKEATARNPPPSTTDPSNVDLMLESGSIEMWLRRIHGDEVASQLTSLSPEDSLLQALHALRATVDVHYLTVMNPQTGNAHYLVTHKRLLAYLHMRMHALPYHSSPWRVALGESTAGTWGRDALLCVTEDEELLSVLHRMIQRRISAVPVVLSLQCLTLRNIFCTSDFMYVVASEQYKRRDLTIREVLEIKRNYQSATPKPHAPGHVYTCSKKDSLLDVIEKLVHFEVQRLVVVETSETGSIVEGVVTIADLLSVFETLPRRSLSEPAEHSVENSSKDVESPLCSLNINTAID